MARLEYIRPYEYQEDLRLFALIRNEEHAMFIGYGFKENAVAYVEFNSTLTQLTSVSVNHSDYDVLTVEAFDVAYPFRVYVVNPDNEAGQASNAIEFDETDQVPVLDVLVDGKSVVENQIASIDLTGKLDHIRQPNKIYGTDEDGKEVVFDREQIEGVQHIILNGSELPCVDGTVQFRDIAFESKTVPRVTKADQLYGTDQNGNQVTYNVSYFASSSDLENSTQDLTNKINNLQKNKQDKDPAAVDGSIAIMKSNQSVGSDTKLADLLNTVSTIQSDLKDLTVEVDNSNQEIEDTLAANLSKDWKATSGGHAIENHPVTQLRSSIVLTPLTREEEDTFRDTPNAVVIGTPVSAGNSSIAVGSSVNAGSASVVLGAAASSMGQNSISIGTSSSAAGTSGIAVGYAASASQTNSVAIGPNATASGQNSVAIGYNSIATDSNTVSVGLPAIAGQSASLKRIVNVADPTAAQDAVTKKYADDKISALANRVSTLENTVKQIQSQLNALETTVSNNYTDLSNKISNLQTSVSGNNTAINNKVKTAVEAILGKVYGGGTFDSSTGRITWPNTAKIPVGNLNIYSAGGSGNTFSNAIRSRGGDTDGDIKVN